MVALFWRDTHSSSCLWESWHTSQTSSNREAAKPVHGHTAGVWRGEDTHGLTLSVGRNAGPALCNQHRGLGSVSSAFVKSDGGLGPTPSLGHVSHSPSPSSRPSKPLCCGGCSPQWHVPWDKQKLHLISQFMISEDGGAHGPPNLALQCL